MKIVVTDTMGQKFFPLEVSDDTDVATIKGLCEAEFGGKSNGPSQLFQGTRELTDPSKTLVQSGVSNDDILIFKPGRVQQPVAQSPQRKTQQLAGGIDFSAIHMPGSSSKPPPPQQFPLAGVNPADLTNTLLEASAMAQLQELKGFIQQNPGSLQQLKESNPELGDAVQQGNDARVLEIIKRPLLVKIKQMEMRRRAMADPFDLEAQRFVEEEIKQENINATFDTAIEHIPESFSSVYMLYIRCKVNGHEVKAFVDSGAQSTIMSMRCAERCNIKRLVDERFAGMAKGVGGTQKIVGKIHMAQLQVENDFFPVSFIVLEDQEMDVLFGLDMLRRHHCMIDLKNGVLHMGSTDTTTPFLHESEIPKFGQESPVSPPGSSGASAAPPTPVITAEHEEKISQMVAMGFARDDCIRELNNSEWNVTIAIAKMFEKQSKK